MHSKETLMILIFSKGLLAIHQLYFLNFGTFLLGRIMKPISLFGFLNKSKQTVKLNSHAEQDCNQNKN